MKTVKSIIVAIVLAGSMAIQAEARDLGIKGMLVGAGGGALAGQAIGRDTEGTLAGAAVGGMVGYMVGNELDKQNYDRGYASAQPAVFPSPPPPPDIVPASGGFGSRHYYSSRPWCQNVISTECWHGRCRDVIKTVCFERDRWKHRHWDDRDHWRDNDRHWRNRHWRDRDWRDRWDHDRGGDRNSRHRRW